MLEQVNTEIETLIERMPDRVQLSLRSFPKLNELLEVVLDLGRPPEARFLGENVHLDDDEVTRKEIEYVIARVGLFGKDNRAGIERTLHRISAIRNRKGEIIGVTFRVGRAVYGTIRVIEDLIVTGKSILLVGKPGVGKTTMLREVARVLANESGKRVIVVDTSNEIAGDGDIPHSGIGRARRMQVSSPDKQHSVMIEAVENHMPETIIIDEIGTEMDANASRTIAERGVQLVATAHGNTLENLIMNPTLSDLVGGIHTVTLGDVEARRRRTQKTVLERRAPPTFEVLVEIQGWNAVTVHADVASTVDRLLRNRTINPETRLINDDGEITRLNPGPDNADFSPQGQQDVSSGKVDETQTALSPDDVQTISVFPYGVNKGRLRHTLTRIGSAIYLVEDIESADILVTTKNYFKRGTKAIQNAERQGKPVYVLRRNTANQIEQFVKALTRKRNVGRSETDVSLGLLEAQEAASQLFQKKIPENFIALQPQTAYMRRLQHQLAEDNGIRSSSVGIDTARHVVFSRR